MCIVIKQRDEGGDKAYIPVFQTKVKICWCLHHLSFPEEDLLVWKATASLSSDGADKISALFSISLWPGFREKWIGKPGLFGKWSDIPTLLCHPTGQSVSLRSIEQLPPLVWLINDTLITTISPHGPNRASFCCVSLTAAAHFNRQRFTISLSIIDSQPLLHWRSGVPQGSPLGTTCFYL